MPTRCPRALLAPALGLASCAASTPLTAWRVQDASAERRAEAAAGDDEDQGGAVADLRLAGELFDGAGLLGIDGAFEGEVRVGYRRVTSEAADDSAAGFGLVGTLGSETGWFLRLGMWQLDQGVVAGVDREARRYELALGRALPVGERLRVVLEGGAILEGDYLGRAYPVPPVEGGKAGLFGSDGGTFGLEGGAALRWRLGSVLEVGGGLFGETLREDSWTPAWLVRLNLGAFSLHFEARAGDDEPEWQVGVGLRDEG